MRFLHGILGLLLTVSAHAKEPATGSYKLTGTNPGSADKDYSGVVTIEKSGDSFHLRWYIGGNQEQEGVAFADGDVLSVGYRDESGTSSGVVSFRVVSDRKLEGRWCPQGSSLCGTELLEFESSSLPREEKAQSSDPAEEPGRLPASAPARRLGRFTI